MSCKFRLLLEIILIIKVNFNFTPLKREGFPKLIEVYEIEKEYR